ncbi:unnamed protein product [Sphenostylis stenocarpa]|uniref:Uncharacterized protein n=1 Tax=Sphenostylis stenocarpa TaxID=92480 RepID=A0AA86SFE9_9FABA|nr:unnamed protein product [Sphenostylis stenocarpa]
MSGSPIIGLLGGGRPEEDKPGTLGVEEEDEVLPGRTPSRGLIHRTFWQRM